MLLLCSVTLWYLFDLIIMPIIYAFAGPRDEEILNDEIESKKYGNYFQGKDQPFAYS